MKKVILLASMAMLSSCLLAAEQPTVSAADQKWLAVVQKMAASGQHEITTPVEVRAQLLKDWAKKNGYILEVTKTDSGFHIKLSKDLVKN